MEMENDDKGGQQECSKKGEAGDGELTWPLRWLAIVQTIEQLTLLVLYILYVEGKLQIPEPGAYCSQSDGDITEGKWGKLRLMTSESKKQRALSTWSLSREWIKNNGWSNAHFVGMYLCKTNWSLCWWNLTTRITLLVKPLWSPLTCSAGLHPSCLVLYHLSTSLWNMPLLLIRQANSCFIQAIKDCRRFLCLWRAFFPFCQGKWNWQALISRWWPVKGLIMPEQGYEPQGLLRLPTKPHPAPCISM